MTKKTTIEQLQIQNNSDIQFGVCSTCYWCASIFRPDVISSCPTCRRETLDFMPISRDENYSFEYDEKRGVVLNFTPSKRK
jgi:hypothetical protein